jgi:hypothetical protein
VKLAIAERLLAAIAAVVTLLVAADAYVFKSRVLAALSLPAHIPTAVGIMMFVCPTVVALLLGSRLARSAWRVATLRTELADIGRAYTSSKAEQARLQEQLSACHSQIALTDQKAVERTSLRKQIVSLLATHYYDEETLGVYLHISSRNFERMTLLREVIADLLTEGVIKSHGGGKYALRQLPPGGVR